MYWRFIGILRPTFRWKNNTLLTSSGISNVHLLHSCPAIRKIPTKHFQFKCVRCTWSALMSILNLRNRIELCKFCKVATCPLPHVQLIKIRLHKIFLLRRITHSKFCCCSWSARRALACFIQPKDEKRHVSIWWNTRLAENHKRNWTLSATFN